MKSNPKIATYRAGAQEKDFNDSYDFDHFSQLLDQWPLTVANAETWSTQLLALKEKTKRLREDMQETTSLVDSDRATGSGLSRTAGYLLRRKHVMLNRERSSTQPVLFAGLGGRQCARYPRRHRHRTR